FVRSQYDQTGEWRDWLELYHSGNSNNALTNWSVKDLSVSGSAALDGSLTTQEFVFSQGSFQESDIRSKEDICGMHQVLDKVMQMNPIQYRYKADRKEKRKHLGFGAQEVNELFPELVHYSKEKDLYSLNYGTLGAINTAAIQETNICLHQGLHQHQMAIDKQKEVGKKHKKTIKRLEEHLQGQKKITQEQKAIIQSQQTSLEEHKKLLNHQSDKVQWLNKTLEEQKLINQAQQEINTSLIKKLELQEVKSTQQTEEMQEFKKLLAELSAPTLEKLSKRWRSLFKE
ncbi:tail fiber domain-containing protein, partial [Xanthovirga aplysinae]|uniref:tail fiber domain-containing protein n=1 Tax=Xanthovirga aplysinae TaxID=2529853 RepID=UPI0012BD2772